MIGGLFGTLVVLPKTGGSEAVDVIATAHTLRRNEDDQRRHR